MAFQNIIFKEYLYFVYKNDQNYEFTPFVDNFCLCSHQFSVMDSDPDPETSSYGSGFGSGSMQMRIRIHIRIHNTSEAPKMVFCNIIQIHWLKLLL
jgi:hypothetical protein